MAKSKRKGRRPAGAPASPRPAKNVRRTAPGDASAESRRLKKAEVRAAKERLVRRQTRRSAMRRALTFLALGTVLLGAMYLFNRAASPKPLPATALAAASAADCSAVETPAASAPGNLHLGPGQTPTYDQHPATSGWHYATEILPGQPRVYASPVQEVQAVHTLEHGSVIMYYRASGEGSLPQEVVDALAPVANDNHATYLIPYEGLSDGTALAVTAWNKLMTCPGTITPDQAVAVSQGFVDAFACTSNAPEGNRGDGC
jgi:Protein of unknown function (DUF3105)